MPVRRDLRRRAGLANDIPTILRAAERLRTPPDVRFVLVGDGKERPSLVGTSAHDRLANVTFLGARRKSEMPAVLAASDACVAILQDIPMFARPIPTRCSITWLPAAPRFSGLMVSFARSSRPLKGASSFLRANDVELAAAIEFLEALHTTDCRGNGAEPLARTLHDTSTGVIRGISSWRSLSAWGRPRPAGSRMVQTRADEGGVADGRTL